MNTQISNINFLNEKILETVKDNFLKALFDKKKDILAHYLCDKNLYFNSKTKAETIEYLMDEKNFNFLNCAFYDINEGYSFANGKGRSVLRIELIHEKNIFPKIINFLFKRNLIIQKNLCYAFEIGIEFDKIVYLNSSTNYFTNEQLINLMNNN